MSLLKTIIYSPHTRYVCRNFAKYARRDPGVEQRKRILGPTELEETPDFEDLEYDFMDVHKTHKEYERETKLLKEREKYLIVKQKYFKEKLPNFLTWHDKEQVRYLHRTDPEEWTVERLSEGFPALPEVIKKVIKSNWTKTKQHKITSHDATVQRNWQLFKDGKLADLPEDLAEHLKKFTSRALNLKPFVVPNSKESAIKVKDENVGTEFVDIIRSYEKLKKAQNEEKQVVVNDIKEIKSEGNPSSRKKFVTFEQLRHNLKSKLETGQNVDQDDKSIVGSMRPASNTTEKIEKPVELFPEKYESSTGIQTIKKTEKDLSHLNYPEKISIPKNIYKKGVIYKLNDCYYDDDGEFLYRVPGMT